MASPADRERELRDDIERIAKALCDTHYERIHSGPVYDAAGESMREHWRSVARALLESDVIRVGRRPSTGARPLAGQMELET